MKDVLLKNGTRLPVETLAPEDLPEIRQLQETVIGALTEKSFLQPLTDEEYLYILNGNGTIAAVRDGGRLIAFRALLDPGDDPEHLGADTGIPREQWPNVLYSEITNVHPEYQGNGFQRQLGHIVMETVDTDRYQYICTTVSPFNIASIKDKLELGMHIKALTVKYGTLTRYVMMKDLTEDPAVEGDEWQDVGMGDNGMQIRLLKEGWTGVSICQKDGDWMVRYRK
ncbi:hypothetical protein NCCP2716_19710 [Sporosarcina sp. NCCP-2716]|uniref:GNAT family N-acetyltransferase n=1 Tax=Sporosarcina sp. NCCP-2716 TaxID=2943679 RepID=UPI00203BE9DA|nr:GNAT family N-acetyltransferase [Sporosarcina sp. NCCP-2716]GKV69473.1 hypothetical protein NCCP2716_19710 [Sporosarcina sp. NCCP-2716]